MFRSPLRLIAFLPIILVGCAGTDSPGSHPIVQTFSSAHFVFRYTAGLEPNIDKTAAAVESQYDRIVNDLEADNMPVVQVTFFLDHAQLEQAVAPIVIPSWAVGLATAPDRIYMMSPNLSTWGSYDTIVSDFVHEFAHCVSLHINPGIANNPRWLWESIAIYESRQFVDPHTLSYMVANQPPTLQSLNDMNDTRVYEVGYLIGEFIVARWGQSALHNLIINNSTPFQTLNTTSDQFQSDWFAFVKLTYGI